MVPAEFTEERFELFERYQKEVHGDTATRPGFERFLCTPAVRTEPAGAGAAQEPPASAAFSRRHLLLDRDTVTTDGATDVARHGRGAFHMLHRVDGRLVAIGVVDVLTTCLSSVYLVYDPRMKHLSLGRLTALLEIEWVRQASTVCPDLHFYCMGYYVHTCHKMRYKADYRPSELLCHETRTWHPLSECTPALDRAKYARFAPADAPAAVVPRSLAERIRLETSDGRRLGVDDLRNREAVVDKYLVPLAHNLGPTLTACVVVKI